MSWRAGPTLGTTPTARPPTGEDWVAMSPDGAWFWDGDAWQRTAANPRSVAATPVAAPASILPCAYACPNPNQPAYPAAYRAAAHPYREAAAEPGLGSMRWLLLPLLLVGEILARGFARAVGVVVSILSFGVTIALLVWLFRH